MKRIMNVFIGATLAVSMLLSLTASANSSENIIAENTLSNNEVVYSLTRGTEIPTANWNFELKDKYEFDGQSTAGKDIYTSYRFAGAPSGLYTVYLKNKHSHYKLVVKACRASDGKVLQTFNVKVGESETFAFSTTSVWYLKICGSSDFEGYVDG